MESWANRRSCRFRQRDKLILAMCGRYRLTVKERYLRDHFGPGRRSQVAASLVHCADANDSP
jgi:hypothetical protein